MSKIKNKVKLLPKTDSKDEDMEFVDGNSQMIKTLIKSHLGKKTEIMANEIIQENS